MKAVAASVESVAPELAPSRGLSWIWPLLFFAALWLEVIRHLRSEWSFNPQYSYGWGVPFLALYLFWRRWPDRPAAQPPRHRFWSSFLVSLSALLFLPGRFVGEANPDWRLLSWALTLAAIIASLGMIFLAGGWPWVRYFAFPFLFFLVAVPWPAFAEQLVTQNLMRAVTAVNVFFLNLAGVPALRLGNVIEVGSGLIGIEEACSGVRSLQATLMISLFLGELYSFNWRRRIFLVGAGALLAFLCNLVRTAILVWVGAQSGAGAIHAWHDPAGFGILLVTLVGLWLVSLFLRRRGSEKTPATEAQADQRPVRFAPILAGGVLIWLLLVEGGVQLWYYAHRSPLAGSRWSVQWPNDQNGYRAVPIAPEAESLLRFDDGGGATWESAGREWMMYFFHWQPGRTAALFVKTHRPDVCLPASGMTLVRDGGIQLLEVNGIRLPVRGYRFEKDGQPLHVFYCYWDARSSYEDTKTAVEEDWTPRGRWRAALRGRRELGAQMLEVAVWGYEDDAEAKAALEKQLAQVVVRT